MNILLIKIHIFYFYLILRDCSNIPNEDLLKFCQNWKVKHIKYVREGGLYPKLICMTLPYPSYVLYINIIKSLPLNVSSISLMHQFSFSFDMSIKYKIRKVWDRYLERIFNFVKALDIKAVDKDIRKLKMQQEEDLAGTHLLWPEYLSRSRNFVWF